MSHQTLVFHCLPLQEKLTMRAGSRNKIHVFLGYTELVIWFFECNFFLKWFETHPFNRFKGRSRLDMVLWSSWMKAREVGVKRTANQEIFPFPSAFSLLPFSWQKNHSPNNFDKRSFNGQIQAGPGIHWDSILDHPVDTGAAHFQDRGISVVFWQQSF